LLPFFSPNVVSWGFFQTRYYRPIIRQFARNPSPLRLPFRHIGTLLKERELSSLAQPLASAPSYIHIRARLRARSKKRNRPLRCSSIRTYVLRLRGGIGSDRDSTSRNSSHCFQTGTGGV